MEFLCFFFDLHMSVRVLYFKWKTIHMHSINTAFLCEDNYFEINFNKICDLYRYMQDIQHKKILNLICRSKW